MNEEFEGSEPVETKNDVCEAFVLGRTCVGGLHLQIKMIAIIAMITIIMMISIITMIAMRMAILMRRGSEERHGGIEGED